MSRTIGCPSCGQVVTVGKKTYGAVCTNGDCSKYFKVEDAKDVQYFKKSDGVAIHGGMTKFRSDFRGNMEQMAQDQKDGVARQKGASSYPWRFTRPSDY